MSNTTSSVSSPKTPEREIRMNQEREEMTDDKERRQQHDSNDYSKGEGKPKEPFALKLPSNLQWIPENWVWSKIKPVIRCAVAGWLSVVLFVIPPVEIWMGQASFIILIASFLSPPSDPFMAVLERETLIISMVSIAWAWGCLGMKLADLARVHRDPSASLEAIFSGQYIEAAPTVILLVFIFTGAIFFLYIRARQGPGPYLFACIFGCICLDISFTIAILSPYPFYDMGKNIIVPLGFHSCIALLTSVLIFPQTVSAQFTTRLQAVLTPLIKSLELHRELLQTQTDSPSFSTTTGEIVKAVKQAEGGLVPLAVAGRLLQSDLIYGRFAPNDFRALQKLARRMAVRANGMTIYFTLIDPTREKFPITPVPSRPGTPGLGSPVVSRSRAGSPERATTPREEDSASVLASTPEGGEESPNPSLISPRISRQHRHHYHHHSSHSKSRHSHSHLLHHALLHVSIPKIQRHENAVGVFESQRYLDLENTVFKEMDGDLHVQKTIELLHECCDSLLGNCRETIVWVHTWLGDVRKGRLTFWVSGQAKKKQRQDKLEELQAMRDKLYDLLQHFKNEVRYNVLEPYRPLFDSKMDYDPDTHSIPSHRNLFHCYVYQYHLQRFVTQQTEMLDEIIKLEKERQSNKLWTPVERIFKWSNWQLSDTHEDDEDPDTIQGLEPAVLDDLGLPRRRDPDALPPNNAFEWVMNHLYRFVTGLGGGNALYAVKAGVLTIVMCIPSSLRSTGQFAYENRFVWAIFMGQLTLARFRGDTTFGLVARIMSTFLGGLVGMVMWYVSSGSGKGNAYGLAAVCAVCFPFFYYARLYWPGPPMTNIIFHVTAALVIGYSYQDQHIILPGNPGVGWDVAWRRFVLVTVGVTAAFIFSFLPPTTTIRRYQRATLATTCTEIGGIYCAILSYAHSRSEKESSEIVTSLIAIRSKLNRSVTLKANVIYEFSLRGRWPAERYQKVLDLQLQLAYSLSHLMSVIEHLEPAWTRAFLKRTRFLDPDFQGDLLAVITLIATSLRTGTALPQITPCPLVDRYLLKYHGLNVIHTDSEEDYGLPRSLTMETLQDEQYMMFCVGVSTAFTIVSRLDRLMVAAKEIVGEHYHIHGVGATQMMRGMGIPMGSRTNTLTLRLPERYA